MTKKSEKKKEENKEPTWPNNVFEIFLGNNSIFSPPIFKLGKNLPLKSSLKMEEHILSITESIKCKAYLNKKNEIIKSFSDEQAKIEDSKKRKPQTLENMPELQKLMNIDSGFSIDKLKININDMLPDLTLILMKKIAAENTKEKPNLQLIERYENQILQERERILTGEDMAILKQFFEFEG